MSFQINQSMISNLNRVGDSALRIEAQNHFKIEYIPLDKIVPNPKNFYAITDIDDLAESIFLDGLQHNITVRQICKDNEDDCYEIISGERRYTAFRRLYEKHGDKYKFVPAKVVFVDDIDAEVLLIQSNATGRIITPMETLKQVERLTALYLDKKARGDKLIGRVREAVALDLNLGTTQVSKYQAICKNLDENLLSEVETGNLAIKEAAKLAQLPKQAQADVYKKNKENKLNQSRIPKNDSNVKADISSTYKYSYICPGCGAELYSKSVAKVRCLDCDADFILGEL